MKERGGGGRRENERQNAEMRHAAFLHGGIKQIINEKVVRGRENKH